MATRECSGECLNNISTKITNLIGGSADLTPSNNTFTQKSKDFNPKQYDGTYIRFGVREHSMIGISNGIAYYGVLIPFCATFLIFSGYGLGSIRVGALSKLQVIYILTHDSIGLGEDGPTHQPIEMLPLFRSIPNLVLIRPADGNETVGAYKFAISNREVPTMLILSRQTLPQLDKCSDVNGVSKGAYIIFNGDIEKPDLILISTGSEVHLCLEVAKKMENLKIRVISFPCWTLFDQQPLTYKREILLKNTPIISVEASSTVGWSSYSHYQIGMTTFGASAPADQLFKKFKINFTDITEKVKKVHQYFIGKEVPDLLSKNEIDNI